MMKKKIFCIALVSAFLFQTYLSAQDNVDYKYVTGSWLGKMPAGGINLRVIFNISLAGKDSLSATLDSPDQGAKNIKIGPVIINGKEINIKAPLLLGEYRGTFQNDTLISGIWSQRGSSSPLDLSKLRAAFSVNRPQEPKPPFPYISEEVTFNNDKAGIKLAGTLTIPEGTGPFPAVILITGSGSQNRNEELLGHKPFLVIADHLTRNGIAVLRCDDRGVGKSGGSPVNATSADFATDIQAAYLFLTTRKDVNTKAIGLSGHSEGGIIAPIVASENQGIAFIISLAGTGVKGLEIINTQNQDISLAAGIDEKDIRESIAVNTRLFAVLKKEADNQLADQKIKEVYIKILKKKKTSPEDIDKAIKQLNASMNPVSYDWLRYFLFTDPSDYWKKVRCPVLALNGELDLQVSSKVNLPAIEKALTAGGNSSVITKEFPGLNHLFQHCKTGAPSEYGEIEETFSLEVLKVITEWILALPACRSAY